MLHVLALSFLFNFSIADARFRRHFFRTKFQISRFEIRDSLSFYAVCEWSAHAKNIEYESDIRPFIVKFFRDQPFASWAELFELEDLHNHRWWSSPEIEAINWTKIVCEIQSARRWGLGSSPYYTSLLSFCSIDEMLLQNYDPNESDEVRSYSLLVVLAKGHFDVAKLLLWRGASIDAKHKIAEEIPFIKLSTQETKLLLNFYSIIVLYLFRH